MAIRKCVVRTTRMAVKLHTDDFRLIFLSKKPCRSICRSRKTVCISRTDLTTTNRYTTRSNKRGCPLPLTNLCFGSIVHGCTALCEDDHRCWFVKRCFGWCEPVVCRDCIVVVDVGELGHLCIAIEASNLSSGTRDGRSDRGCIRWADKNANILDIWLEDKGPVNLECWILVGGLH